MIGITGSAVIPVADFHQLASLQRVVIDIVSALGRIALIPLGLDAGLVESMRELLDAQLLSPTEAGHA